MLRVWVCIAASASLGFGGCLFDYLVELVLVAGLVCLFGLSLGWLLVAWLVVGGLGCSDKAPSVFVACCMFWVFVFQLLRSLRLDTWPRDPQRPTKFDKEREEKGFFLL